MVLGRCGFLSTVRYASELSKNRYGHNRIAGSFLIPSIPLSITERRPDRSEQHRLSSSHLSVRMASTVANDTTESTKHKDSKVNRLALEKSSYLLQHATNPVNWYPWCDEALERAKREDKVIFLSVGYSTCHWCHVMEKESFMNKEIAEIMNQNFINIKVDREERPDIDRIYMTFIMATTQHGGWPMSVFLSPDLKPISGGTYFPPEDRYGCRGFKKVLLEIARKWKEGKIQIVECGEHNIKVLEKISHATSTSSLDLVIPVREISQMCVQQLAQQFEPTFGGFVSTFNMWSPKFPQPVNFNFLFHMYAREPDEEVGCLHMCVHTLTKMVNGGIHDHVGQGFSRYSVDGMWHVPHFEKMLYDQGQLMQSFADAFVATKTDLFAETIDDIATYVARDLRHKEGGFYSAEDADSYPEPNAKAKKEGAFYVWTMKEIKSLLTKKISSSKHLLSDVFCHHYNVKEAGNLSQFQDPHNELKGKNVLIVLDSIDETAQHFNLSIEDTKKYLKEACSILYTARSSRPRPHLDDKIVAAWNGLMISGFARGGTVLDNNQYIEYAIDAAKFIERYLFDKDNKVLLRTCYRGENDLITQGGVPIEGFVDDYAFVIKGFLDLYEACLDDHWLELAEELQDIQDKLFWDEVGGGYFSTTTKDSSIILRLKDVHDGAEPTGNSIAAGNLLRLAAYFGRSEFKDKAERMFKSFRSALMQRSGSIPQLTSALLHSQDSMTQIYIAGKQDAKDTNDLRRVIYSRLIPGRVLLLADESKPDNILFRKNEFLRKMKQQDGRATVYVCRHHTCSLPVTCPNGLAELLDERQ